MRVCDMQFERYMQSEKNAAKSCDSEKERKKEIEI